MNAGDAKHMILARALRRWAAAGLPLADRSAREARLAECAVCEYWRPRGNFGLGECGAPGCGCTKLKAWLATEDCTHPAGSRWAKIQLKVASSE